MINKENRLKELNSYKILDTSPEEELDEIAEIASLICDVPISLITLLDEKRQWFKAKKGLEVSETKREDSFCQHALHKPEEVLVIEDSHQDSRFKNSALVEGDPKIRFYAGAPLKTPNGNVLGTLCIIDRKPREISTKQKKALKILAKKAMDYLNARKVLLDQKTLIEKNAERLKKLTDNVPGGIFQLRMTTDYELQFEFLSKGIQELHPEIDIEQWLKSAKVGFSVVHPEDIEEFQTKLMESYEDVSPLHIEYRAKIGDRYNWHLVKGKPEKMPDGSVVWYGSFQDINSRVQYENTMEQIAFDISHVLRRPITSLLGLTELIEIEDSLNADKLKKYSENIKSASLELDTFTKDLNQVYEKKKAIITGQEAAVTSL